MMNKGIPKPSLQELLNEKKSLEDEIKNKNLKLINKMSLKKRIKEIDKQLINFDPTLH